MVDIKDKWGINTNFTVNGPHKQREKASNWLWKIHDEGIIEHESDEEVDSDSSSIDIWLKYSHNKAIKGNPLQSLKLFFIFFHIFSFFILSVNILFQIQILFSKIPKDVIFLIL